MQSSLLLQLLILLVVANGTAVVAKKLFGGAFARPLDGGALFVDGQPLFGPSKTIRGIVVSILATSICAVLMALGWKVGTLIATFAMTGALTSTPTIGLSLPGVYVVWLLVLVLLYPICRWFAELKERGSGWWWSYL